MNSKIPKDLPIKGSEATIVEFWSWAYSDLLSNTNRGILAEFLVGNALGLTNVPRIEWDKADFVYNGKFIEVKSSAYIQTWKEKQPSKIIFNISKARAWDSSTGEMSSEAQRNSDCYVFCVFADQDKSDYDILNVNRWDFYVLSTSFLNYYFPEQKSISLSTIQKYCEPVKYRNLKENIDSIMGSQVK
ncbi:hypothetical protein [Halobacillus trueperi]|uniref:Uncharacterized protein n=1 Tax=Halobacillus trueperi TaxID=156205 RepID=A0A3E0J819_9BACI|nr:hypothetical protein [Halobacillus trueperi]REJ09096.1 hypothetical protein DYE48_12055 [Halobacillus trueperi]